nr:unnamed protein product [Callosobruchus analis]
MTNVSANPKPPPKRLAIASPEREEPSNGSQSGSKKRTRKTTALEVSDLEAVGHGGCLHIQDAEGITSVVLKLIRNNFVDHGFIIKETLIKADIVEQAM